jgi:beta-glucanase (GH16 family)
MRLSKHAAMVGLATATISFAILSTVGCSNPPTQGTGTAGANGSGTAGSGSGQAGTGSGQAGTGSGQAGTGSGQAGTGSGQAGTGPGTAGAAGGGTAGATAGASGNAGSGGGTAGTSGMAGSGMAGTSGGGGATNCPMGVKGHCNADTGAVDKYPGFTLALAEEFDNAIDLNADPIWTWSDGGPPEGQARFGQNAITFANGQMTITATAMNVPASISYAEPAVGQNTGTAHQCAVASGEFRTKYNNYRYGRYETKLTAPVEDMGGPDGNYLSTMFTFRTPKWDHWREIDIELEANIKGMVAYNLVNADNAQGYPGGDAGSKTPVAGYSILQPHVYAFEWTPTKVVYYVDGNVLLTNTGNTGHAIPTLSAKIMMNLWVFASAQAFGDPTKNKYPFHSTYDYFRFYKWNMETMYPVDDPHTQLTGNDVAHSQNNSMETGHYP